jgi:hypothetical protein
LFGGNLAAQSGELEPIAKFSKQLLRRWHKRSGSFRHNANIPLFSWAYS